MIDDSHTFYGTVFTGPDHGVCPLVVTPHCTHIVKGEMDRRFLTLHVYSHLLSLVRILHCIKMVWHLVTCVCVYNARTLTDTCSRLGATRMTEELYNFLPQAATRVLWYQVYCLNNPKRCMPAGCIIMYLLYRAPTLSVHISYLSV